MLRLVGFAFGVCLCASSVARADAPAAQVQTTTDADQEIEFAALVEKGDRARAAGRNIDAAKAYEAALKRKRHPVISGRYGLVLMKLGHLDKAAEALHAAFERGQGVETQERRDVASAYDQAKALTTWVNVDVSQGGATIIYDGSPLSRDALSSFWMFAMPGEHTLRAKLDGYKDAEETFSAKPGDEITVTLKLVPLALPELPAPPAKLPEVARRFPPTLRSSNIATDPNYSTKEDPFYESPQPPKPPERRGPRFSVMGGVVTVFGVASWNPAVGGVVGVGLRLHENFSIGLEGRAAWLTTPVAGREAISAMTAGGILSACGHVRWFLGCGLGYVGTVDITVSSMTYRETTLSYVQPGVGARIGAEFSFGSTFIARANFDALRLTQRVNVWVGNVTIVDQAPVMLAAQMTGEWRF